MKTTSRYALAVAALLASTSMASAADLGGNCCADLEERIAELEATTVRKGNRKISLTISGYVSHHVMFWDDGTQSDMYIGDGGNYGSRWRFVGTAKITPQVTAGFLYEWAANTNSISSMNQLNGGDDLGNSGAPNTLAGYAGCGQNGGSAGTIGCQTVRDTTVWMRHVQLGMIKVGHGSTATDNLVLIDLGGLAGAATPDVALYGGGMILRNGLGLAGTTGVNWTAAIRGHESWDTNRRNHVLYETPTLHGFSFQAAVAEDNYWDVALRYAGEMGGFRIAAGIGYIEDTKFNSSFQQLNQNGFLCTTNCDVKATSWLGSASILHVQSGLWLDFAAGNRQLEGTQNGLAATAYAGPDLKFWWVAGGIAKNVTGLGNTVLFAEYGEHEGGLAQASWLAPGAVAQHDPTTNNTVTSWGLGVVQYFDAAAMEVFATYKNFSLDGGGFLDGSAHLNAGVHDLQLFIVGTRISF